MEHAEALERIEVAAAEPLGLERLMAGDTPEAAAVAGHLAGCPACVEELARIRQTSALAREVIRATPDPALRDRTLAYVRALGRDRSALAGAAAAASARAATAQAATAPAAISPTPAAELQPAAGAVRRPDDVPAGPPIPIEVARVRRTPRLAWVAGLAAALVLVGVLGFAAGGRWMSGQGDDQGREVAVLQDATETAMRIAAQPDSRHVALAATAAGGPAAGDLVFSPGGGELVMTATDLADPAPGGQYGCWVEVGGQRVKLGRMYWAGDIWTWAGPANGLADLPDGSVFGVSLVPAAGGAGEPVLTGSL